MVSSMSEASAVIELRFFSKENVWSVIMSFLLSGSWNIFHPTEILLLKFNLQKNPFHHRTYTYEEHR